MTDGLKWTVNHVPGSDDKFLDLMSEENEIGRAHV